MIKKIKEIRPLIIGIGIAGRRHLEAQLNLGLKTGIFTTNTQTAKSLKQQNNIVVFDNLDDGIDWANLVQVCTPDDKHTEFVARALKKRKVVLCEKSFTTSLNDALYLQTLAHHFETSIIVGQNYRLTPTFAETKIRIQKGQLGNISRIEVTYFHDKTDFEKRDYRNQYFLYIGGSHALDLASWIVDEKIVRIQTFSENNLSYDIKVEFSSGLKGDIKVDATLPRFANGTDLIVYGEKGKLVSHNKLDKLSFYKSNGNKTQTIVLPNTKTFTIPIEIKIVDDYLSGKTLTHWPLPAVDEAVNLIKVFDVIKKSISSGKSERV